MALAGACAALAVSLMFGIYGGAAFGTETPPENTALPTISPTTPYVGAEVKSTNGTWSGSPTSYTRVWKRCAGAECETISGATKVSYTPVSADLGKSLKVAVTATNAAGSTTAESKATSAGGQIYSWYTCEAWGGTGVYHDSNCTEKSEKSNFYSWLRDKESWAPSVSTNSITAEGAETDYILKYTISGVNFQYTCQSSSGSGSLVNNTSQALIENYSLTLNECAVTSPSSSGCVLPGNKLTLGTLTAHTPAPPAALESKMTFEPASGEVLATYKLENCFSEIWNGTYTLNGWFPAQMSNGGKTATTTASESLGDLKVSGVKASIDGLSTLTTASPMKLDLAP